MKRLHAFDLVFLAYLAVLSVLTLLVRPPGWWVYLAYHVAAAGLVWLAAYAYERYGGGLWSFIRYWYVVPMVLGAFREIHYLVPGIHPFDDHPYDRVLAEIDRNWFGDVDGFFLSLAQPQFIDFLHVCYWSYYVIIIIPGAALFFRKEYGRLNEYLSVVMTAFYLSYLGYFLVPAIGPHHFFEPRPEELDGWLVGGAMHRTLLAIEWRMPDAFPSGHVLLTLVMLVMTWRHHRRSFWLQLIPGLGVVWATMALRYHYVVDVVASVVLLPGVIFLGIYFNSRRESVNESASLDR